MIHGWWFLLRWFILSMALFFSSMVSAADFQYRIADAISPFFDAQKPIRHFSSIPYDQLDLATYPYVDTDQLAESKVRFLRYLEILRESGYDAITLDDVVHMVTLELIHIYPPNSPIALRNSVYKSYFRELISLAKKRWFRVFITSDMPFYTPEIKKRIGDMDVNNPKLLAFQKTAFEEIFTSYDVDGIVLRVGEGGKAYNLASGYQSEVLYTTPEQIHNLLVGILPIFEKYQKKCIFRTWTIGFWSAGDLLWNPVTYHATFSGISSPSLIVSIKYTPWDFFAYRDENLTIGTGTLSQIIEVENRREYEWWGDFVNFMGFEYATLFQKLRKMPQVVGVWAWNQQGGWGFWNHVVGNFGFNFWNELNLHVTGKLLQQSTDVPTLVRHFLDGYPFTIEQKSLLYRIILDSRSLVLHGWYIHPYTQKQFILGRTVVPPLLWIWWDQVTASPPILAQIFLEGNLSESIIESEAVLTKLRFYIRDWQKVADSTELSKNIGYSLENEYRIFEILRLYKGYIFNYFTYGDGGNTSIISQKISEYNTFLRMVGPSFHFDFSEILPLFSDHQSLEWKRVMESFLIVILTTYLVLFFWYRSFLIESIRTKWFLLGSIVVLLILAGVSLFVGPQDFYWYFVRIGMIMSILMVVYFFFYRQISRFLGVVPRISTFEKSVTQVLIALIPIVLITEIILWITLFVGDGIFWIFSMKFVTISMREILIGGGVLILLCVIWLFIWIDRYMVPMGITKKQKWYRMVRVHLGLIVFLYLLFLSGIGGMIFLRLANWLYPDYFLHAGSSFWDNISVY